MFGALLGPRALAVAGERLGLPSGPPGLPRWRAGRALTRLVDAALAADGAAMRAAARGGLALPGFSLWAVCRAEDRAAAVSGATGTTPRATAGAVGRR